MEEMVRQNIGELETRGFVNVPYPSALRESVLQAMHKWEKFCTLPGDAKQQIGYSADGNVSGVGYELKLEKGATNDLKEDFHIRATEVELLRGEADKVGSVAQEFIEAGLTLTELIAPTVGLFAETVEKQFGLKDFSRDTKEKQPRALLRFLHYFGDREVGEELAVPHADKGGFTLHLYESHPGLEHLTHEGQWAPMTFTEGETAIIPAMRLQLRSKNRLKATCHRVVATHETAKPGRFSAVCFMDFAGTPYYDKMRCGRLQDRAPGFNYAMPYEEFSKLFVNVRA